MKGKKCAEKITHVDCERLYLSKGKGKSSMLENRNECKVEKKKQRDFLLS